MAVETNAKGIVEVSKRRKLPHNMSPGRQLVGDDGTSCSELSSSNGFKLKSLLQRMYWRIWQTHGCFNGAQSPAWVWRLQQGGFQGYHCFNNASLTGRSWGVKYVYRSIPLTTVICLYARGRAYIRRIPKDCSPAFRIRSFREEPVILDAASPLQCCSTIQMLRMRSFLRLREDKRCRWKCQASCIARTLFCGARSPG